MRLHGDTIDLSLLEVSFSDEGGVWKMWRDSPGFSQRMMGTFSEGGNTITSHGGLSRDDSTWDQDLTVT